MDPSLLQMQNAPYSKTITVKLYLDLLLDPYLSVRLPSLLHRLRHAAFQQHHSTGLRHTLAFEVEEHVLIDATPSLLQPVQFGVRLVEIGFLAAMNTSLGCDVQQLLLIKTNSKCRHLLVNPILLLLKKWFYNNIIDVIILQARKC